MLTLPLLLSSLTGLASNYNIDFGYPEEDRNVLIDATGADLWTYSTEGVVSNLSYSENMGGLCFYLEKSDNGDGSLSLTTVKTFSGIFQGMNLFCDNVDRLVVKLYAGQRELGEMEFNGKAYGISGLDDVLLMNEPITLKFMIAETTIDFGQNQQINNWEIINGKNNNLVLTSGVQVSGLSKVEISVDDTVFPLSFDEPVAFDSPELETADLSNYSYKGILFTLNMSEDSGDGFDKENGEGGITIGSVLTDAAVEEVNDQINSQIVPYRPGYDSYAYDFSGGITLMVCKGKGILEIDAENDPEFAYHIKVGNNVPVERSSTTRQWLTVPYDVDKDTYVYIYMVQEASGSQARTRIGRRGTAHGKIYYAKCASNIPGDVDGNGIVNLNDVNAIVDYIMGTPPVVFNFALADVNVDDDVNAADLVKVIQIVLGTK